MPEKKQHNAKAQFVAEHTRAFALLLYFCRRDIYCIVKQRE
jgi:hypothetical protein